MKSITFTEDTCDSNVARGKMNKQKSLSSMIITSRLAVVGSDKFVSLGLTPEELQLFLTVADRKDWTESMRRLIPALEQLISDEEE